MVTETFNWTSKQRNLVDSIKSAKFKFYLLRKLPMGFLAGLKVTELDEKKSVVSVPFKWLNQNPFQSIYFAVQSMAAELSTASHCLIATQFEKPTIAFIIIDVKANFTKKATDRVYFTCEDGHLAYEAVEQCKASPGESQAKTFHTTGRMKDGTIVAQFEFTWSFKQRSS